MKAALNPWGGRAQGLYEGPARGKVTHFREALMTWSACEGDTEQYVLLSQSESEVTSGVDVEIEARILTIHLEAKVPMLGGD